MLFPGHPPPTAVLDDPQIWEPSLCYCCSPPGGRVCFLRSHGWRSGSVFNSLFVHNHGFRLTTPAAPPPLIKNTVGLCHPTSCNSLLAEEEAAVGGKFVGHSPLAGLRDTSCSSWPSEHVFQNVSSNQHTHFLSSGSSQSFTLLQS